MGQGRCFYFVWFDAPFEYSVACAQELLKGRRWKKGTDWETRLFVRTDKGADDVRYTQFMGKGTTSPLHSVNARLFRRRVIGVAKSRGSLWITSSPSTTSIMTVASSPTSRGRGVVHGPRRLEKFPAGGIYWRGAASTRPKPRTPIQHGEFPVLRDNGSGGCIEATLSRFAQPILFRSEVQNRKTSPISRGEYGPPKEHGAEVVGSDRTCCPLSNCDGGRWSRKSRRPNCERDLGPRGPRKYLQAQAPWTTFKTEP